jgi:hypothetical protein
MGTIIKLFRKFNKFFEIKFGWFFVNGHKYAKWDAYITKRKQKNKQSVISEDHKNTLN